MEVVCVAISRAAATMRRLQPRLLLCHLQPAPGEVGPDGVAGEEGTGRVGCGGAAREGGERI